MAYDGCRQLIWFKAESRPIHQKCWSPGKISIIAFVNSSFSIVFLHPHSERGVILHFSCLSVCMFIISFNKYFHYTYLRTSSYLISRLTDMSCEFCTLYRSVTHVYFIFFNTLNVWKCSILLKKHFFCKTNEQNNFIFGHKLDIDVLYSVYQFVLSKIQAVF